MGDIYDQHEELADEYKAGPIITSEGGFDVVGGTVATGESQRTDASTASEDSGFDIAGSTVDTTPRTEGPDPLRPEPVRGRYPIPDPVTGKMRTWQRTTNFTKLADDTYHLELWKNRNVAKGLGVIEASQPGYVANLARYNVKADKAYLNSVVTAAENAADAYAMSDEGTALHTSTELVDLADGDLSRAPERHRKKVQMYRDALAAHGLRVVPSMIERRIVSTTYDCAGTFDRVLLAPDNSYVMADLKTGDSIDLALPSIAAQLNVYEDGLNEHGVFDGDGFDTSIKVRDDYGIVIHLPSTRDEVSVVLVSLHHGRQINAVNLAVRDARKIKAKHVTMSSELLSAPSPGLVDAYWIERLNAAHTAAELASVAQRARSFGQWNERLAGVARLLSGELSAAGAMGS